MKRVILFTTFAVTLLTISCNKSSELKQSKSPEAGISKADPQTSRSPFVLNMVIQLDGSNEVPPVSTATKGQVHLRLTSDSVLYSKIIVQKVAANDTVTAARIHAGANGVNGQVRYFWHTIAIIWNEHGTKTECCSI